MRWAAGLLLMLAACAPPAPVEIPAPGRSFKDCVGCPEMMVVPAGNFGLKDAKRYDDPPDGWPVVTLPAFAIGKFEVTQREWMAAMGDNPAVTKGESRPVESVSWNEVQSFLARLNAATGRRYRLPSETEWDYAAGGGHVQLFPYRPPEGTSYAAELVASLLGYSSVGAVGTGSANGFGLHDMYSNVGEWVQDCFQADYRRASADGRAVAGPEGCDRVVRGRRPREFARAWRTDLRRHVAPNDKGDALGFRLALSLP